MVIKSLKAVTLICCYLFFSACNAGVFTNSPNLFIVFQDGMGLEPDAVLMSQGTLIGRVTDVTLQELNSNSPCQLDETIRSKVNYPQFVCVSAKIDKQTYPDLLKAGSTFTIEVDSLTQNREYINVKIPREANVPLLDGATVLGNNSSVLDLGSTPEALIPELPDGLLPKLIITTELTEDDTIYRTYRLQSHELLPTFNLLDHLLPQEADWDENAFKEDDFQIIERSRLFSPGATNARSKISIRKDGSLTTYTEIFAKGQFSSDLERTLLENVLPPEVPVLANPLSYLEVDVIVKMPGPIIATRTKADSIQDNAAHWKLNVLDLNQGYKIEAVSQQTFSLSITAITSDGMSILTGSSGWVILGGLVIVVISGGIGYVLYRARQDDKLVRHFSQNDWTINLEGDDEFDEFLHEDDDDFDNDFVY